MMLRGIIAIGIGVILGIIQQNLISKIKINLNFIYKSLLEILLTVLLFTCYFLYKKIDLIYIYTISMTAFSVLFLMYINKWGILSSKILNKKIFGVLGLYSYPIYIMQAVPLNSFLKYISTPAGKDFISVYPVYAAVIMMIIIIFTGILSYKIVNFAENLIKHKLNI